MCFFLLRLFLSNFQLISALLIFEFGIAFLKDEDFARVSLQCAVSEPPVTSALCLVLGARAYILRRNHRFSYAFIELLVGIYAAYSSSGFIDAVKGLQFAGGLYIIVRALDNFEKAAQEWRTKGSPSSKRIFFTVNAIINKYYFYIR